MSWAETQVGLFALSPPQVPGTDGPPGASAPVGAVVTFEVEFPVT